MPGKEELSIKQFGNRLATVTIELLDDITSQKGAKKVGVNSITTLRGKLERTPDDFLGAEVTSKWVEQYIATKPEQATSQGFKDFVRENVENLEIRIDPKTIIRIGDLKKPVEDTVQKTGKEEFGKKYDEYVSTITETFVANISDKQLVGVIEKYRPAKTEKELQKDADKQAAAEKLAAEKAAVEAEKKAAAEKAAAEKAAQPAQQSPLSKEELKQTMLDTANGSSGNPLTQKDLEAQRAAVKPASATLPPASPQAQQPADLSPEAQELLEKARTENSAPYRNQLIKDAKALGAGLSGDTPAAPQNGPAYTKFMQDYANSPAADDLIKVIATAAGTDRARFDANNAQVLEQLADQLGVKDILAMSRGGNPDDTKRRLGAASIALSDAISKGGRDFTLTTSQGNITIPGKKFAEAYTNAEYTPFVIAGDANIVAATNEAAASVQRNGDEAMLHAVKRSSSNPLVKGAAEFIEENYSSRFGVPQRSPVQAKAVEMDAATLAGKKFDDGVDYESIMRTNITEYMKTLDGPRRRMVDGILRGEGSQELVKQAISLINQPGDAFDRVDPKFKGVYLGTQDPEEIKYEHSENRRHYRNKDDEYAFQKVLMQGGMPEAEALRALFVAIEHAGKYGPNYTKEEAAMAAPTPQFVNAMITPGGASSIPADGFPAQGEGGSKPKGKGRM